ncbi:ras and Rab interactor 2-like isoform X2 [Stigmatopora argus]
MMDSDEASRQPADGPMMMRRSCSFFKLIDAFALEIGQLKKEMVGPASALDRESVDIPGPGTKRSSEMFALHQGRPQGDSARCERDYGYDSLGRKMSVLERLTQSHPAWLLLTLGEEEATRILLKQPPGVFLVRKSVPLQRKVLSVRLEGNPFGNPIAHFPLTESHYTFSLEGSGISFADLFRLVAFYCISRDVLSSPLQLPEAIASAKTQKDLEEVARLGQGFWDSALCGRPPRRALGPRRSGGGGTERDQPGGVGPHCDSAPATLCRRPPSPASEKPRSSSALCFVDPLFFQTRQRRRHREPASDAPAVPSSGGRRHPDQKVERQSLPPPRPPPPRFMRRRRPAPPPPAPESVPGEASPAALGRRRAGVRRPAPPRPTMGNRDSGPAKSGGAPVPAPPKPPPPPIANRPPADDDCHVALDDETIARALSLVKRPPSLSDEEKSCGGPPVQKEKEAQRLSGASLSTSSSDSLEFSPSAGFSLDPSSRLNGVEGAEDSGEGDDDDGEEEEEEEVEEDYGVGLEADLESRLRPSFKSRRRWVGVSLGGGGGGGGVAFILPRALKGRFRKVSGMLAPLMTPETRAVKRIVDLSRDKNSYFGSLVQDYIRFVQEKRALHPSGEDFLQTLRHFMTQMKAYLCQSSEMDPPIESLIPQDTIEQVLEKAMHKCVLKPLKTFIDEALHQFQVNSGDWQQMKENFSLAKSKKPHELGVDGAAPPDALATEKIRHKFLRMRKMYSPEKKVAMLLRVCKLIYTIMQDHSGRMYGADDFLPMLTYVVAQCDMPQLDLDIQYMMELLDPSLLQGEGGYYLTSAYGAMALIKNFQEEQAARVLSSEARNTLHRWHRRRTAQRSAPTVDDFQVADLN